MRAQVPLDVIRDPVLTKDPPPPRVPRAITPTSITHGARLVTATADGHRWDLRGYGNPYYLHLTTGRHWEVTEDPPDGLSLDDPEVSLSVDACWEAAWYAWKREGRDPAGQEPSSTFALNAALTWIIP